MKRNFKKYSFVVVIDHLTSLDFKINEISSIVRFVLMRNYNILAIDLLKISEINDITALSENIKKLGEEKKKLNKNIKKLTEDKNNNNINLINNTKEIYNIKKLNENIKKFNEEKKILHEEIKILTKKKNELSERIKKLTKNHKELDKNFIELNRKKNYVHFLDDKPQLYFDIIKTNMKKFYATEEELVKELLTKPSKDLTIDENIQKVSEKLYASQLALFDLYNEKNKLDENFHELNEKKFKLNAYLYELKEKKNTKDLINNNPYQYNDFEELIEKTKIELITKVTYSVFNYLHALEDADFTLLKSLFFRISDTKFLESRIKMLNSRHEGSISELSKLIETGFFLQANNLFIYIDKQRKFNKKLNKNHLIKIGEDLKRKLIGRRTKKNRLNYDEFGNDYYLLKILFNYLQIKFNRMLEYIYSAIVNALEQLCIDLVFTSNIQNAEKLIENSKTEIIDKLIYGLYNYIQLLEDANIEVVESIFSMYDDIDISKLSINKINFIYNNDIRRCIFIFGNQALEQHTLLFNYVKRQDYVTRKNFTKANFVSVLNAYKESIKSNKNIFLFNSVSLQS
jgi:hypothetical protein